MARLGRVGERVDPAIVEVGMHQLGRGGKQREEVQRHPPSVRRDGGVVAPTTAVPHHLLRAARNGVADNVEVDPVAPVRCVEHLVGGDVQQAVDVGRVLGDRRPRRGRIIGVEQPQLGPLGAAVVGGHDHAAVSLAGNDRCRARCRREGSAAVVAVDLVQLHRAGVVVADQQPPFGVDVVQDGRAELEQLHETVGHPSTFPDESDTMLCGSEVHRVRYRG